MQMEESLNAGSGVYFEGELIDSLQTPHQLIEVFDTPEFGKLMRIDGANMTSERDEFFYHENLVHPAAITHPAPRRVLIVGGGDGGSAEEILKYASVEKVVLAELDAGVIEVARKHFFAVHRGALDDARVEIRIGDGLDLIRESSHEWDLIYLDLTDPDGPAEALYTPAFYTDCHRALNVGGAVVLHIGSPFSHTSRVAESVAYLRAVFSSVTPYFVHVPAYGAVWGFAIATDALEADALDAGQVDARLAARGIGLRQFYNGAMHVATRALPEYILKALERP
jgi:spermidine synthase